MNFKSKLRATKSYVYFIGLINVVVLSIIFQGCEKEELDILDIPQENGLCNVKQIPMSELPEGIEPLKVHSRKEFENIIYHLNHLEVKATNDTPDKIISEKKSELVVGIFF